MAMTILSSKEHQLIERIMRRIDKKATFEAHARPDGDIDLKVSMNRVSAVSQVSAAALLKSADDVTQFETLRNKIKRVFDRMQVPAMPTKMPKAEIQKDLSFGPRQGGGGFRGGRR